METTMYSLTSGSRATHIDDLPNELLMIILELAIPTTPASLGIALSAASLLSPCFRWRAVALDCLRRAPFTAQFEPWKMSISGKWKRRKLELGGNKLPRLVLEASGEWSESPGALDLPPYQIAFQTLEELEIRFRLTQLLPDSHHLRDVLRDSSLRVLEIKGDGAKIFQTLKPGTFPHLVRLSMEECLLDPVDFATVLLCMPILKKCGISMQGNEDRKKDDINIQSFSLVSLLIAYTDPFHRPPWSIEASFPNLKRLTWVGAKPFQMASPFASSTLQEFVGRSNGACFDRQHDLEAFLKKCCSLQKLVIPTEFTPMSVFFNKVCSGELVPKLKDLECGPFPFSTKRLVEFLLRKGFVDAPPSTATDVEALGLFPRSPFSRLMLHCLSTGIEEEIVTQLVGVTSVVGFA